MLQGSHGIYTDKIWPCDCGSNAGLQAFPSGLLEPTWDGVQNMCQDCGQLALTFLLSLALPITFFAFLANCCLVWKQKELVTGDWREDPFPKSALGEDVTYF